MKFDSRCVSFVSFCCAFLVVTAVFVSVVSTCFFFKVIDFNRDVRPILSENCYTCHGPDSEKRKAGLRFDKKEVVLGELKSGDHVIVFGNLAKSVLVSWIIAIDKD